MYEETPPSHPQPEPPAQPAPAPPAVPAPVPPVNGKVRKLRCRRSDDWDPATVHAAYKKRFPHRQMTMADLPAPQSPEDVLVSVLFALFPFLVLGNMWSPQQDLFLHAISRMDETCASL